MIHNCFNGALEAQCTSSILGVASEGFHYNPHQQFLTFFFTEFLHICECCSWGLTQLWAFHEAQFPKLFLFNKADAAHQSVTIGL